MCMFVMKMNLGLTLTVIQWVNDMNLWETALYDDDKDLARVLVNHIDHDDDWKEVCSNIEYPYINAWDGENCMTSHFRRTLVELKLLSVYGKHTWKYFNKG